MFSRRRSNSWGEKILLRHKAGRQIGLQEGKRSSARRVDCTREGGEYPQERLNQGCREVTQEGITRLRVTWTVPHPWAEQNQFKTLAMKTKGGPALGTEGGELPPSTESHRTAKIAWLAKGRRSPLRRRGTSPKRLSATFGGGGGNVEDRPKNCSFYKKETKTWQGPEGDQAGNATRPRRGPGRSSLALEKRAEGPPAGQNRMKPHQVRTTGAGRHRSFRGK